MAIDTVATWHQLVRDRNPDGLDGLLAENVVFHSPVLHTPQNGKMLTTMYLTAAFHVLANETFQYVREIVGSHDAMLEFEVEIDGISINGADMIKWDNSGRIIEFKVMVRPLKALNLLHQMMEAMLRASQQ